MVAVIELDPEYDREMEEVRLARETREAKEEEERRENERAKKKGNKWMSFN